MKTAQPLIPDTPLMKQYQALKARYPHAVLFFRLGDFYEMFGEDARKASSILGLVLTSRQGVPMCGVPAHSAASYLSKLLKAGEKVAIADQMEDPASAKGLVQRQVTRLITPGTVLEDSLLEASRSNYLLALEWERHTQVGSWGIAWLEVSTGEFWAAESWKDPHHRDLFSWISRLSPAEILISEEVPHSGELYKFLSQYRLSVVSSKEKTPELEAEALKNHPLALKAARRALGYATESNPRLPEMIPGYKETKEYVQLDENAIRTLELVESSGTKERSLWGVLDLTRTSMGSRKLKEWILHPLTDVPSIESRQNCVRDFADNRDLREEIQNILKDIPDLERIVSRLSSRIASPKELGALRNALRALGPLRDWHRQIPEFEALAKNFETLSILSIKLASTLDFLEKSLCEDPPLKLSDGGAVRQGFSPELDELKAIQKDARSWLAKLEAEERQKTNIPSLKVSYNSVFGYYLEVTKAHLSKVPASYVRKQTLVNAERFITEELKALESKILGAEEKILRIEAALFEEIRAEVLKSQNLLRELAQMLSELDVLACLAECAERYDYSKPEVALEPEFQVKEGRHPVVERFLPPGTFVPNDTGLNDSDKQIILLTGPNMSGKSTFLRQNALIAVMAQMGSFVPAKSAVIGVVDKILTRIGSHDSLSRGESTFMVEMKETASILNSATSRSLLILDEVGRGTSTYDGISIAWALLEHLSRSPRPKTLFATHYFELTELEKMLPGLKNFNVEVREWKNKNGETEVVFLHKISRGPADRSYGIHVAKLAGLPEECLKRSTEILAQLENGFSPVPEQAPQAREIPLPLFEDHSILQELKGLDPMTLSPLEALEKIAKWKKLLSPR